MRTYKMIALMIVVSTICFVGVPKQFMSNFEVAAAQQNSATEKNSQSGAASKTVVFSGVSKNDAAYKNAIDAHDLAGAQKLVGQSGAFRGTVSRVFQNQSGSLIVLDFDPQYTTALTAVLRRTEFAKFPDMKMLDGKEIVVTGKFVDYKGKIDIVLIEPEQIKLVAQ